jgi:hypothetical protein
MRTCARRWRACRKDGDQPRPAKIASVGATSIVAALLSIGAAIVHFAVIAQHFDEWWLTGMFFLTIAVFQLGWGLLVLLRPSALVFLAGAVVNALIVVTWIVSPDDRRAGRTRGRRGGGCGLPRHAVHGVRGGARGRPRRPPGLRSARQPARHLTRAAGLASAAVVASLTALALVILAQTGRAKCSLFLTPRERMTRMRPPLHGKEGSTVRVRQRALQRHGKCGIPVSAGSCDGYSPSQ